MEAMKMAGQMKQYRFSPVLENMAAVLNGNVGGIVNEKVEG